MQYTGVQAQILEFLGQGLASAVVASAVGVTESYVSQLLAEDGFRQEVRKRRVAQLQEATSLDQGYTRIEKLAQAELEKLLPVVHKPRDILDIIRVINATKRRGASEDVTESRTTHIIEVRLPTAIAANFIDASQMTKDSNNQIVRAGGQSLLTAQPDNIRELASGGSHEQPSNQPIPRLSSPSKAEIRQRPEYLSVEDLA